MVLIDPVEDIIRKPNPKNPRKLGKSFSNILLAKSKTVIFLRFKIDPDAN